MGSVFRNPSKLIIAPPQVNKSGAISSEHKQRKQMDSWRWQGPVVAISNGEKYFRGVAWHRHDAADEASSRYAVGDCVQLKRDGGGSSDIAHIMAMWEARNGGKYAEVRYYCNASAVDRLGKASCVSSRGSSATGDTSASNEVG